MFLLTLSVFRRQPFAVKYAVDAPLQHRGLMLPAGCSTALYHVSTTVEIPCKPKKSGGGVYSGQRETGECAMTTVTIDDALAIRLLTVRGAKGDLDTLAAEAIAKTVRDWEREAQGRAGWAAPHACRSRSKDAAKTRFS